MIEEIARVKRREEEILKAFQATIIGGMKIRHRADGARGTVLGVSSNISYDLDVSFENEISPVYRKNLLPDWWPWEELTK